MPEIAKIQSKRIENQNITASQPSVNWRLSIRLKKSSIIHKPTYAADPIHAVNPRIEKNPSNITNNLPLIVAGAVLPYPMVLGENND